MKKMKEKSTAAASTEGIHRVEKEKRRKINIPSVNQSHVIYPELRMS